MLEKLRCDLYPAPTVSTKPPPQSRPIAPSLAQVVIDYSPILTGLKNLAHSVDEYYPEDELPQLLEVLVNSYFKDGVDETSNEFYKITFDGNDEIEFMHGDKALAIVTGIDDITRYWLPGYAVDSNYSHLVDLIYKKDGLVMLTMPYTVLEEVGRADSIRTAR